MKAEVLVVENLRDDEFLAIEFPGLAILESTEDAGEVADVVGIVLVIRTPGFRIADLAALVAEAFLHRHPEVPPVDELDLALALLRLPVGEDPDVGGDAGIVEKLLRQGDDGFQPIVLDDPAADLGLARAGIPGEQRRAVENNADAAAAILRRAHLRDHVLEEQQRAVIHPRQPSPEAPLVTERVRLLLDRLFLLLPSHAEGWIGEHIVEGVSVSRGVAVELILGEGIATPDVVSIFALDQHVRLANRPGSVVQVLAEQVGISLGIELLDVVFRYGEHPAGAAGRIVNGFHHMALRQIFLGG